MPNNKPYGKVADERGSLGAEPKLTRRSGHTLTRPGHVMPFVIAPAAAKSKSRAKVGRNAVRLQIKSEAESGRKD
jgi:hypothetical protein